MLGYYFNAMKGRRGSVVGLRNGGTMGLKLNEREKAEEMASYTGLAICQQRED